MHLTGLPQLVSEVEGAGPPVKVRKTAGSGDRILLLTLGKMAYFSVPQISQTSYGKNNIPAPEGGWEYRLS